MPRTPKRAGVAATPPIAHAAAMDAGQRSADARAATTGKASKWSRADYNAYVAMYARLRPLAPAGQPCDSDGGLRP